MFSLMGSSDYDIIPEKQVNITIRSLAFVGAVTVNLHAQKKP